MIQEKSISFLYYHREYRHDAPSAKSGGDWLGLAERVGMSALPFVALNKRYKIQAFEKQTEEWECKLLSAKLQEGGMPEGYSKESIRLELKSLGFDVLKIANNGNTVLHQAVIKGNLRAVELSLAYGFEVSRQNNAGDTALHLAAAGGRLDIVQFLVERKADWRIKNNLDQLAFHKGLKHQSLIDYFVSLGYVREHSMHEYATAEGLRPDYVDRQGNTFYHRLVLSNNLPLLEEAIKSKFRLDMLEKTNHENLRVFGLCRDQRNLPALQIFFDQFGKGYGALQDLAAVTYGNWLEGLEAMIPFCRPTPWFEPYRPWNELSVEEMETVREYLLSHNPHGWGRHYNPYPGIPAIVQFLLDYDFQALRNHP